MLKKLNEDEEILFECLHMPRSYCEIMFDNIDNLISFSPDKFCEIRPFQEPMQSFEFSVGEDPEQSEKENFLRKKGAGDCYAIGSRNIGKTIVLHVLDILQSAMMCEGSDEALGSFDANHVRKIFSMVTPTLDYHPCYKGLKRSYQQHPTYSLTCSNGYRLDGINENIANVKKSGDQWFGHHKNKIRYEEYSKTTHAAQAKMKDAQKDIGCILRLSGMSNITKFTPAGEIYDDPTLKDYVMSFPQFMNKNWDPEMRERRLKDYKSIQSLNWKMFVEAEIIEDGSSALDMSLVRKCYNEEKEVKVIEITKQTYDYFKMLIDVIDTVPGTTCTYVASDIGDMGSPSEITVFFDDDIKIKYRYNIVLRQLIDEQQYDVFYYLIQKLNVNVTAIDNSEGIGRSIYRRLLKVVPAENLFAYMGQSKITVDFEKDNSGNVRCTPEGKPITKEEFMSEWSIHVLKDICYSNRIDIAFDPKLDEQLSGLVVTRTGNRTVYASCGGEHILDSFKTFCCAWWQNHLKVIAPVNKKKFDKIGV